MNIFIRKFLFPTLVLIGMIFFAACEYEPTGQNFVEVDQDVPPLVFDAKLNWDKDTVWLPANRDVYLIYNFTDINKEFIETYFFVDDSLINSSEKINKGFPIVSVSSENQLDTQHVTLEAHFASGTGSLADIGKLERFVVQKKWVVIRFEKSELIIPELKFEKIAGKLKISWEKSILENVSYRLHKSIESGSTGQIIAYIDSIDQTYFFDPHSVGEPAYYRLSVIDNYYSTFYYSPWTQYEGSLPQLYGEKLEDNKFRVYWNKSPFPENFRSYYLTCSDDEINPRTIVNINDTSFTTGKFTLGASRKYYLRTNPQEPHKYQNSYDRSSLYLSRITIMNGSPSFEFDYFVRNAGKNHISYYEPQSRKYKIYDISKDSVLGTLLGEGTSSRYVTSSYNGKYIAYFEAGNVNIVEDLNVDNTKAYSTSILTNGAFSSESGKRVLSGLTVSDNGLMSVSCSNMIFLYDLSKNKYINSFVCEDYRPGSSYLSYDGKFLVGQDGNGKYICYKIENDELIKLFILDEHHFIDFNQKETNKILVRHKKTDLFQLICIDPYSVLKELNSNDDLIGVDAHNSTFATGTSNSVKVYSLDNLQLIKEISTVRIPAQSFYKNNTIYFEEGFKIDLGD